MIKMMKWNDHQHYRQTEQRPFPPKWIKVASKLLDDPDFSHMTEHAQLLLLKLWLIASQTRAPDGEIAMNLIDVAWRLRLDEGFVYRTVLEISTVKDAKTRGEPQWLLWEKTPLDKEFIRRLEHEGLGLDVESEPSLENTDPDLDEHLEKLAESRRDTPEEKPQSRLGLAQRGGEGRGVKDLSPEKSLDVVQEIEEEKNGLDSEDETEPPPPPPDPATAAAKNATWITPYLEVWEQRWGEGSFPLGQALRPIGGLRGIHGDPKVMAHFQLYCRTKESEYATPANFQRSFEEWNPEKQERSSLTPELS